MALSVSTVGLLDIKYADKLGHEITLIHSEGAEPMRVTTLPFVSPAA